jgi:uncharacterized protein YdhG (YjbR/CyaY superfamily)
MPAKFESMDDYVVAQTPEFQEVLNRVRPLALAAAPPGVEAIRYEIPTIKQESLTREPRNLDILTSLPTT